jgi:hypothetical protein
MNLYKCNHSSCKYYKVYVVSPVKIYATYLLWTRSAEHIPKPNSFIRRASCNGFPIRRHGQIQHSLRMAGEVSNLFQLRKLPTSHTCTWF